MVCNSSTCTKSLMNWQVVIHWRIPMIMRNWVFRLTSALLIERRLRINKITGILEALQISTTATFKAVWTKTINATHSHPARRIAGYRGGWLSKSKRLLRSEKLKIMMRKWGELIYKADRLSWMQLIFSPVSIKTSVPATQSKIQNTGITIVFWQKFSRVRGICIKKGERTNREVDVE